MEKALADRAAVIGSFDGVHKGHATLIRALLDEARKRNIQSVAITFDPPPSLYFNPHFNFLLTTKEEKEELLLAAGIAQVRFLGFSGVVDKEPERFVSDELLTMNIRLLTVGQGFRFGRKRAGDVEVLRSAGQEHGFDVRVIAKEEFEGEPISATRIRELLLLGHICRANALLGYEYRLKGEAAKGLGRAGALLDTPTVNLKPDDTHKLVPSDGIYAVRFGTGRRPGICYIGSSPTFGDSTHKIEAHLLEGSPEEETKPIIHFVERLRPDRKFSSLAALKEQVKEDVAQARRVLSQR